MGSEHFLHYFLAICLVVMLLLCAVLALPQQSAAPESGETETAAAATKPTAAPTQTVPVETTQPPTIRPKVLKLTAWPETIAPGEVATLTVKGFPETEYAIEVHYSSGISQSASLQPQCSDADGIVSWSWKVSKNAGPGTFWIVVTGGGESVRVEYTITE